MLHVDLMHLHVHHATWVETSCKDWRFLLEKLGEGRVKAATLMIPYGQDVRNY